MVAGFDGAEDALTASVPPPISPPAHQVSQEFLMLFDTSRRRWVVAVVALVLGMVGVTVVPSAAGAAPALPVVNDAALLRTSGVSAVRTSGSAYRFRYTVVNLGRAACVPQLGFVLRRTAPTPAVMETSAQQVCLGRFAVRAVVRTANLGEGRWTVSSRWRDRAGSARAVRGPSPSSVVVDTRSSVAPPATVPPAPAPVPDAVNGQLRRSAGLSVSQVSGTTYRFAFTVRNDGQRACIPALVTVLHRTAPSWQVADRVENDVCLGAGESHEMVVTADLGQGLWFASPQWLDRSGHYAFFQHAAPAEQRIDTRPPPPPPAGLDTSIKSGTWNVRNTIGGSVIGSLSGGQRVHIACQAVGPATTVQHFGTSTIFDHITSPVDGWVSDLPMADTPYGVRDGRLPACTNVPAPPPPSGRPPAGARTYSYNPFAARFSDQCTYYAEERMHSQTGMFMAVLGNAYQWADQAAAAGWTVGSTPAVNSVVVFPANSFGSTVGHVAWVVDVSGGQLRIQDYNWNFRGAVVTDHWVAVPGGTRFIYSDR